MPAEETGGETLQHTIKQFSIFCGDFMVFSGDFMAILW